MAPLIDIGKLMETYKRLSRREKGVLHATAAVVLIVLLDLAVVSPIHRSIKYLDQRIQDTETNIKKSVLLLAQKEQVMRESEFYAAYVMPSKSSEERTLILLKRIEELANQASINLLFVKPAGAGASQQEGVDKVNLECEGQIDQIINFFYSAENSKLLVKIEKFSLQPASKGSSVVRCSATIAMSGMA